jgi:2-oxoglutarate ferredoxin oxidoreductase subunit alpha
MSVAQAHLRHLNPLPPNLGEVLARYRRVLIPENNLGQLATLIRARYLVDAVTLSGLRGRPFRIAEVERAIADLLGVVAPEETGR